MILVIPAVVLLVVAVGLVGWMFYQRSRLRAAQPKVAVAREPDGLGFRGLLPMARQLAGLTRGLSLFGIRERYARMIEQAGLPFELSADEFLAVKLAAAVIAIGGALLIHFTVFQNWLVAGMICFLGLVYPDLRLSSAVNKQKHDCLRALPGFLDLLALSAEAGMGFDAAVLRLTEILEPGPLIWRFQAFLRSVNVGMTRNEALREMARKMDLPDFTAFVTTVTQASETGASLAPVLRTASAEMLVRRFERAEKAAHELPVKILLPLFVFVFPATFLMVLVPLYFQLKASGAMGIF